MSATAGTASVAGYDVFEHPLEVKRRIGYLPETPPLYLELLVGEYLSFICELRKIPRDQKKRKMDAVLERCQIGDVRNRLIGNLSKGYRQRVGLAQAMIHDPEVLILDEPTVGLDPKQVSEARGLIKSLRTERTVIYSTHILSEVAATCDRIVIIDRGKIVAQEAINALGSTGATAKTEVVVQKMDDAVVTALKNLRGVKDVQVFANGDNRMVIESDADEQLMTQISKAVVTANAGLIRMSPVQLALEEYYLDLIRGKRSEV
jgi:ABC-2 type transport system ATP-binding protein